MFQWKTDSEDQDKGRWVVSPSTTNSFIATRLQGIVAILSPGIPGGASGSSLRPRGEINDEAPATAPQAKAPPPLEPLPMGGLVGPTEPIEPGADAFEFAEIAEQVADYGGPGGDFAWSDSPPLKSPYELSENSFGDIWKRDQTIFRNRTLAHGGLWI